MQLHPHNTAGILSEVSALRGVDEIYIRLPSLADALSIRPRRHH